MSSLTLRPAAERDHAALRLLLPAAIHFGSAARALVAVDDRDRVFAAAALSPRLRADPLPGPRIALHVAPPFRRQGVARQLIAAASDIARSEGAHALYAWDAVPADSDHALAWQHLGFDHACHVLESRADFRRALDYLQPFLDQVRQRQWIPDNASLLPLDRADHHQVARLHVQHLGGSHDDLLARLRAQTPDPWHPELSPVLLLDSRVVAFSLARPLPGGIALAESTVVDPLCRGGWANLWLKTAGASAALRLGLHTLLFFTYDHHTDTRKLSRQVGVTSRQLLEPYRLL